MIKEIKCPCCNVSLEGRDKMYRSIIVEDSDWFGIVDGKMINYQYTYILEKIAG